jgi:dTDP-glucose 4,6-dehydratase
MKILVTGGCGFIGSNFINGLVHLDEVEKIVNLDVMTYAANQVNLFPDTILNSKYYFQQGNILSVELLKSLHERFDFDTVIHFAAESHVDNSIMDAGHFIDTNINGTFVLIDTFNKLWTNRDGKKFIHVSTDEVFGALGPNDPAFTKNSPYRPNSPYAASKAASDLIVRSYIKTHKFPAIITNCSNNFGPNQHSEKLIPLVINRIVQGKSIPVYGDGTNIRDWIFVGDHCRSLWNVLTKGQNGNQYLIGGGHEISNIDLINQICDIIGKGKNLITFVEDRKGHDFRYAIDTGDFNKEIGVDFERGTFEENLKQTVTWYLNKP